MSDDIVTRLRLEVGKCECSGCGRCVIEHKAADEIERIRKQREELAWAIAWFLNGGSRERLEQRFRKLEITL